MLFTSLLFQVQAPRHPQNPPRTHIAPVRCLQVLGKPRSLRSVNPVSELGLTSFILIREADFVSDALSVHVLLSIYKINE